MRLTTNVVLIPECTSPIEAVYSYVRDSSRPFETVVEPGVTPFTTASAVTRGRHSHNRRSEQNTEDEGGSD